MTRVRTLTRYSNGRKVSGSVKDSKLAIRYRVADFETITDPNDCRVWAWGLEDIKDPGVEIGTDIDSFMNRIDDTRSIIYFHNLKFDGSFIVYWLLTNGYEHIIKDRPNDAILPGEFTTLMSDMGKFYSMTVVTHNGTRIEFRDSLKKLPMSVARIATSFQLGEVKGDLDYHEFRPIGHEPTADEADYIRRDVSIVSQAMKITLDSGAKKLTAGSDALAEFKQVIGQKYFTQIFPTLHHNTDAEIRRAYRGGFTYLDPRYAKRRIGKGRVYDVNSLYPSVMYAQPMPYGEPQFVRGRVEPTELYPLTIFAVTFTAKLKPGHIPCIQIKGQSQFMPTEYLESIDEPTTLMVTDVDWKLYNDHYDIEVLEYCGGYRFKQIHGIFRNYIDKWMEIKANSEGGKRELAKLMLNSLYGKFASNPNVTSKYPVIENDRVVWKRGLDEQRPPVYTAVGVYITSYARDVTVRAAQENYDTFAYADTDSLHLITEDEPKGIRVHKSDLGAWKHEYDFDEAMYLRPKAYLEHCYGKPPYADVFVNRIAGVPEAVSKTLRIDTIRPGMVIHGKLTPKQVPGGTVLVDTPYELNY